MKTCENCNGKCCRYVALEIDAPESLEEFEDIKWYVVHKNINVYVDEDYEWHIEFLTPCEYLDEEGKCKIYDKRPQICREYSQEECLHHNSYEEEYTFQSLEDVEKYIEEVFNKGLHVTKKEVEEDEDEEDSEEDENSEDEFEEE